MVIIKGTKLKFEISNWKGKNTDGTPKESEIKSSMWDFDRQINSHRNSNPAFCITF